MNAGSLTRLAVLIIGFPAGFAVRIRIAPYDSLFPKSVFCRTPYIFKAAVANWPQSLEGANVPPHIG